MEQEKTPRVSDVDVPMKLTSQTRRTTYAFLTHVTWKVRVPGFLQLSLTLQTYISSYFFYLLYLFWGKKKIFFHLLQVKLGVQITATVSPQRPGGWGRVPHSLAAPGSPETLVGGSPHSLAAPFSVSPHRDVLQTDFFLSLNFCLNQIGGGGGETGGTQPAWHQVSNHQI